MPWCIDLDSTLVDTAPDPETHVNSLLKEFGRPGLDLDEVPLMVGDGARTLLRRGLEATGGAWGGVDLDLLYARFLERYTARPADRSTVHQDVIQVLHSLQAQGLRLGFAPIRPRPRRSVCSRRSGSTGSSR